MTSASAARRDWVAGRIRDQCFGGDAASAGAALTFGAELELLVLDHQTHAVSRIFDARGSLELVHDVARRLGWRVARSHKGVPRFTSVGGGALTFEPGGQIEYASAVHPSVDGVLDELREVEAALRHAGKQLGISLVARGVDPCNGANDAPLQLTAERYRRMARYFATIGDDGARMMRQTASLQVNIGGVPAAGRWDTANAIAPWLVALFANSPRYAGADTGFASYRAETWRGVDAHRTGVFALDDAVREYTSFALAAPAFLCDDAAPPFSALHESLVSAASLDAHLSTLFPEVRPRGYLELRSIDAVEHADRVAALAFVAGIIGDAEAARDARAVTGAPDAELLRTAGRDGLRDPRIAAAVGDLVDVAVAGCTRLGTRVVSEASKAALSSRAGDARCLEFAREEK